MTTDPVRPTLVIGGESRSPGGGESYDVVEPATGKVMDSAPLAGPDDVAAAVESAAEAFPEWKAIGPVERAQRLREFVGAVRARAESLATLDTRNTGNPIAGTRHGAGKGADVVEFFAGLAPELGGATIPATTDHLHYTRREPHGVVGVITAYNHPSMFALARTGAALMAGNCVVLKPATPTPLSALEIGRIATEHLPPGVFNVVTGDAATGDSLVRHPMVRRVNFTGSLPTALRIQQAAAESGHVKHLGFQLGGKNPLILLEDVGLDVAVAAAVEGMNLYKVLGQSCGSTSRVFVHRSVYSEFVAATAARLEELRTGDPLAEDTDVGALISAEHRDRVAGYVAAGRDEGATLVCGGQAPRVEGLEGGFFYRPTLFADVEPTMRIATEEIFGPVLSVIPWSDEEVMLDAVNSVRYGLTAGIYSNDLARAHRLVDRIEVGYVWVNDVEKRWIGVPFGGVKDSGTSTEFSVEELLANTRLKSISISLGRS